MSKPEERAPGSRDLDDRGLPAGYTFREDWEVTPRQVRAMQQQDEPLHLLDCRTPQEHAVARIEGAKLLPLQEVGQRLAELEPHRHGKIVIHCHHGGRSLRLAAMLRQQGFADVTSMAGGIDLWAQDIDSNVPRY